MDDPAATEVPKQRYQGVQKESAGYKLLASMGWKEGEGLGASKQGIKEHIRVKKKFENWGVGAVEAAERARDWSTGMVEFHRVLSTLSEITSQHASRRSGGGEGDSSSDESDASDGELARQREDAARDEAQGKAKRKRKGDAPDASSKKAATKEKKKKKKAKRADTEPTADEGAAPVGKRTKVATHLGRFTKRESAKTVKNYSSTDLAAILGGDPFAAVAAAAAEVRSVAAATATSSDSDGGAAAAPAAVARQSTEQQRARQQEASATAASRQEQDEAEAAAGLWWSGYFTRSGRMGALRRAPREDPAARGFTEQQQADLYTRAQGGAAQGRVGLGRYRMPKKVAGTRWEGKRTRLGSGSEDEGAAEGAAAQVDAAAQQEEEQEGIVVVLPASQRQQQGGAVESAEAGAELPLVASAPELAAVKWRRAAAAALKGSGKSRLKLARLHKAVMRQEGLDKRHKAEVARLVTAAVESSAKFTLADDVVQLAS